MFPSIQIQDTSHTIGQTLIVIVLPWQSVQSVTIYRKTEKTKDSDREKAEEEWCLPYLPPRDPFWAACIQPALSCLWQVLLFSLSLSLSLSHTRSCFLSTLPRSAFQTKARGKIPAPKFRCCWLNKPSQWKSRQQPMRKQEGRWTQPYETEKERAESSGEWCRREWGGGELSSQRETRQRR